MLNISVKVYMFKIIHNIAVNIQMTLTTHRTVRTDSPITSMRKLLKLKHWSFMKFYNSIFFTKPIIEPNGNGTPHLSNRKIFVKFDSCSIDRVRYSAIVRFCSTKFNGSITKIGSIEFGWHRLDFSSSTVKSANDPQFGPKIFGPLQEL